MNENTKVKMVSFNGTSTVERDCDESENYWKLIGATGTVIKEPSEKNIFASFSEEPRVLVQFDIKVEKLGLNCHNNIPNSLWLLVDDLKAISNS